METTAYVYLYVEFRDKYYNNKYLWSSLDTKDDTCVY